MSPCSLLPNHTTQSHAFPLSIVCEVVGRLNWLAAFIFDSTLEKWNESVVIVQSIAAGQRTTQAMGQHRKIVQSSNHPCINPLTTLEIRRAGRSQRSTPRPDVRHNVVLLHVSHL